MFNLTAVNKIKTKAFSKASLFSILKMIIIKH